jgi:hypothetical protein
MEHQKYLIQEHLLKKSKMLLTISYLIKRIVTKKMYYQVHYTSNRVIIKQTAHKINQIKMLS